MRYLLVSLLLLIIAFTNVAQENNDTSNYNSFFLFSNGQMQIEKLKNNDSVYLHAAIAYYAQATQQLYNNISKQKFVQLALHALNEGDAPLGNELSYDLSLFLYNYYINNTKDTMILRPLLTLLAKSFAQSDDQDLFIQFTKWAQFIFNLHAFENLPSNKFILADLYTAVAAINSVQYSMPILLNGLLFNNYNSIIANRVYSELERFFQESEQEALDVTKKVLLSTGIQQYISAIITYILDSDVISISGKTTLAITVLHIIAYNKHIKKLKNSNNNNTDKILKVVYNFLMHKDVSIMDDEQTLSHMHIYLRDAINTFFIEKDMTNLIYAIRIAAKTAGSDAIGSDLLNILQYTNAITEYYHSFNTAIVTELAIALSTLEYKPAYEQLLLASVLSYPDYVQKRITQALQTLQNLENL